MTYSFDGFNYLIRLQKGELLSAAIEQFCMETKVEGAWLSGLGAVLEVTLGFYDLDKKEFQWQTFTGEREIAALQGNLAADDHGKMMFHLHGVFSDRKFQTMGGHVKDFTVSVALELFVHRAYQPTRRAYDDATGLQLLDLE